MTPNSHIVGWGYYLPDRRLTNEELEARLDTSDEWIQERTGIRERRVASDEESTASMAIEAARRALEVARLDPLRLDMIIVATLSPEYLFPATACLVQDAIGASRAAAFDVSAGCTGFIYALTLAHQAIQSGSIRSALVIGAETISRFLNWEDRSTCVLFGDGAGAVVLAAEDVPGGILSTTLGADGSGAHLLHIPAGGAKLPASADTVANGGHYVHMLGREVYRFAVRALPRSVREVVAKAGLTVDDISLLIPHQANSRITQTAAQSLGLPSERVVDSIEWCGNTSAASIPIALCQVLEEQRLQEGDLLVLSGFGAGLTWGAVCLRWGRVPPIPPTWHQRQLYRVRYYWATLRSRTKRLWRRLVNFCLERITPDWD